MTRVSALWRLDAFLDHTSGLREDQRIALVLWIMRLQEDALPSPAVEVQDAHGRSIRVAVLDEAGVVVTYRLMASGTPRLLRIDRLP